MMISIVFTNKNMFKTNVGKQEVNHFSYYCYFIEYEQSGEPRSV